MKRHSHCHFSKASAKMLQTLIYVEALCFTRMLQSPNMPSSIPWIFLSALLLILIWWLLGGGGAGRNPGLEKQMSQMAVFSFAKTKKAAWWQVS